jgi:MOSC domain-containing protein YiiM
VKSSVDRSGAEFINVFVGHWIGRCAMNMEYPHVHQINVSDGGVPKHPVAAARVTADGLIGDRQRNRKVHGGRDRAVCLFSLEVIQALRSEGHSIAPGSTGENLTLAGIDWAHVKPGDVLHIGKELRLEVVSYTAPCRLNAQWFTAGEYQRISQRIHPGWSRVYARVLREGLVGLGDRLMIEAGAMERGVAEA